MPLTATPERFQPRAHHLSSKRLERQEISRNSRIVEVTLHHGAQPVPPDSSTDLFLRAVPIHPGRSDECLLIASPPITGFIILGRLATSNSVTRPNRVHLRYGSQVRFPGFRQADYAAPLRFSHSCDRQNG